MQWLIVNGYIWGAVTSLFLPYLWSLHGDAMLWIYCRLVTFYISSY